MSTVAVSRRFVRIKALQQLYAFHINQQANYQVALNELATFFTPSIFSKNPTPPESLQSLQAMSHTLFSNWVSQQVAPPPSAYPVEPIVEQAVKSAYATYVHLQDQDIKKAKDAWQVAFYSIEKIYFLIFRLMLEWLSIAHQQHKIPIEGFCHTMLKSLQARSGFASLAHTHANAWEACNPLALRWYRQLIQPSFPLRLIQATPTGNVLDTQAALVYFLDIILLDQEDIQRFFYDLDISWLTHKAVVKKLLHQLLTNLEIGTILENVKLAQQAGAPQTGFYDQLVAAALAKDKLLDSLLEQHVANWSLERIVELDRILIKLGLCELSYLQDGALKVVINEYVELAKEYSTPKSAAFVNGVLDKIAKII
jgi:N utilization substance protein B